MAEEKPLTRSELLSVLKEAGMVTKTDLDEGLAALERRMKLRMGKMHRELLGAIGKLATSTPTIDAFRRLKARVDLIVPESH